MPSRRIASVLTLLGRTEEKLGNRHGKWKHFANVHLATLSSQTIDVLDHRA